MSRDTCRHPSCHNPTGEQDRDDYNKNRFCSIQCETSFEHLKMDAKEAREDDLRNAEVDDDR